MKLILKKKKINRMPADEDAEILYKKYLISGIVPVIRDKKIVLKILINSHSQNIKQPFWIYNFSFFPTSTSCKMTKEIKQI